MKISLDWLNDYIETGLDAEHIAGILSDQGLPCEGIEQIDGDFVIDVEITSNRGDCLGYIGIARELAVATGKELKIPVVELEESEKNVTEFILVKIHEPDLCNRYTARIIEGVKVGPSPDWLIKRLEAVGLRSVNNVVDATNYAMLETGQPPHAFDFAKINDGKIIVRRAAAGENIISIDGSKCELNPDMLIIADAKVPVAIAGVMGGLETEVSDSTTTILLEDASFNPVSVRTTSRKLSLPSEASYRFERIVDIEQIDWASKRTARLITQLAGGKIAAGVVDTYPVQKEQKTTSLRLSRMKKLLGIKVSKDEAVRILSMLGFKPNLTDDVINCRVPSWRSDIYREVDLIEEVARVYGYDKVPTRKKLSIEVASVDKRQKIIESIETFLNGCGFYETINVTFIDNTTAELFTEKNDRHLSVKDESRKSANLLRQTLIGSLMSVLRTNINAKNLPCRIFELAATFIPNTQENNALPTEKTKLALACDGDLRDIRGVIEGLIKNINSNATVDFVPTDLKWAKAAAEILVNSESIGFAGIVGDAVKDKFDFKEVSPCAAEIDFEFLVGLDSGPIEVKPIPRFPAIQRDLSIIVDEQVHWSDIIEAVNKNKCNKLEKVNFVGIYRDKGIDDGKKSVTLSLQFRDEDGTLTHETVDGFQAAILENLTQVLSAQLRGP